MLTIYRSRAMPTISLDKWLNEALRPLLLHHLEIQNVKADGHFNPIEIERIKRAFLNGKREYTQKIWYLLMYFMWKERWMS